MKTQQGFTLIELMISLVLAMLIIAAVVQVYIISTKTATMQQAASGILDNNVFGMQKVERNLRMAGLGLSDISSSTAKQSGIIIKGKTPLDDRFGFTAKDDWLTHVGAATTSNVAGTPSDQLTIQFRAPMHIRDCEGRLALGPREVINERSSSNTNFVKTDGQVIVERYFVTNNNGTLELRCDAGRYITELVTKESPETLEIAKNDDYATKYTALNTISELGDNGVLVASGIDLFKTQFAVAQGNNIRYMTVAEYEADNNLSSSPIVGVKLAIMTSGDTPVLKSEKLENPTYIVFGKQVSLKADQSSDYIHRVYESNVMLRNSRGPKQK